MAVDLKKKMAKLAARLGDRIAECKDPEDLLKRIVRRGSIDDLKKFMEKYEVDIRRRSFFYLDSYDTIFSPEWMARFERPQLQWIYRLLVAYDDRLKHTAKIVADRRIAAECRAWCFHSVFAARTRPGLSPGCIVLPHYWWYNRTAWYSYAEWVKKDSEDAFIRRLGKNTRLGIGQGIVTEEMWKSAGDDSVSRVEINRELAGRKIDDPLMEFLIDCNAAKCFAHFLANRGKTVFKLRSPEEWLLTVCRCAEDELAVAAADELERLFPGIVGSTRDPWGNNALWSTLCDFRRKPLLQDELVRLGCDPDGENELGLSFRLLRDNTPQAIPPVSGVPMPPTQMIGKRWKTTERM